ncbi:MAG: hypothetical protein V1813_04200, partial [Candidatus Aenigmatarchaeota archaeon]
GFEPYSDSLDGKSFNSMTVAIPVPGKKPEDEWQEKVLKIFINGETPKPGELVDLRIDESFGFPDNVSYVETSKNGQAAKPVRNFEVISY